MSPPLSELSLDHPYSVPAASESFDHCYDTYSSLIAPTSPGPVSDFYTSENLYMWQDVDGIYQWADAPTARSDSCLGYSPPSYYASPFSSGAVPLSDYFGYRHGDLDELSHPATTQDNLYIFQLAQQVRNGSGRPQVQDHRSSIARASDNFLAQGSSIFSDGHSSSRRGSTVDYRSSIPHQTSPQRDPRPPSRKRSRESLDEGSYHLKEEDDKAHPCFLHSANDACRLPKPHMIVPSQAVPSSSVRVPRRGDATTSLNAESHACEHEPRLRPEERCTIPVPKHISNKRVHRSSEELVRQESAILSMPTTWPIPDDQVMKGAKKPGEQKKQALACLFCRERKIACGRPPAHNPDQTCNQCARRRIKCEYPTESRRGQHKRRRKPTESEPASQSTARTNSTSSVASTMTASSSTILTTTTTPSA